MLISADVDGGVPSVVLSRGAVVVPFINSVAVGVVADVATMVVVGVVLVVGTVVAVCVVEVVVVAVAREVAAEASQSIFPTKVAFSPWYFKFLPTVSAFSLLAFPHGTPEQHPVVPEQDPKCKELSSAQCSTTVPQLLVENAPPG